VWVDTHESAYVIFCSSVVIFYITKIFFVTFLFAHGSKVLKQCL
jgi:hypothetical protein